MNDNGLALLVEERVADEGEAAIVDVEDNEEERLAPIRMPTSGSEGTAGRATTDSSTTFFA